MVFRAGSLLSATPSTWTCAITSSYGSETKNYVTYSSQFPNGSPCPTTLTAPVNAKGRVEGTEFAYQQAFTDNFGFIGNYTYADGKQTSLVTIRRPPATIGWWVHRRTPTT